MQYNLLIRGARILDTTQNLDISGDLLVLEGKIAEIKSGAINLPAGDIPVIDAKGYIVCPGFIDLHCHLREPGYEEKETIATGTRSAARGGFTTVCCMPNTNPPIDNESTVNYVKEKAESTGIIRVLPVGCITKGRQGKELTEFVGLANAGVMGFSDDGNSVMSSRIMLLAMQYSILIGLPIMEHCEDKDLTEGGVINDGWISTRLGLKGMPSAAEDIMVSRNISLANLTGARLHITHVSTKGSVELIKIAKEKGLKVTADVTPHHLLLTDERVMGAKSWSNKVVNYDTNAKVNPPLRTQNDVNALIQGLKDGTIDAIATDHAPHALVDKLCEFENAAFGISGFETAFACLMELVHNGQIDLKTLISALTYQPAQIIGPKFGKLGNFKENSIADITIFDPDFTWKIDSQSFESKGKNTPFDGETVKGKIIATIFGGKIVYQDETLKIKGN